MASNLESVGALPPIFREFSSFEKQKVFLNYGQAVIQNVSGCVTGLEF